MAGALTPSQLKSWAEKYRQKQKARAWKKFEAKKLARVQKEQAAINKKWSVLKKARGNKGSGLLMKRSLPSPIQPPKPKRGHSYVTFQQGTLVAGVKKDKRPKLPIVHRTTTGDFRHPGGIRKTVPRHEVASTLRSFRKVHALAAAKARKRDQPVPSMSAMARKAGNFDLMQTILGAKERVMDVRERAAALVKSWMTRRRKYGPSGVGKKGTKKKGKKK